TLSNGRIKGVGPGKVTILGFDAQSRKDFEAGKITSLAEMVSTKLTVQVMAVPTANAVYLASGKTAALRFNGVKAAAADWELKDTVCDGSGCIELVQNNGKYTGKVRAAAGVSGQATVICRYRGFTWETTVYAENPSLKTEDGITGSGLSYTLSGLAVGETRMLSVQGTHQKPLFTSSKNDVAFVDENGKLLARGKGKAVLQTRICGKTLKLTVTVE
nr:hypothetical protein [Lachnospiraceae bacterium]